MAGYIRCWSNHANGKHSNQTLAEALNNSCNPCFTDIALALGTETFYDYLEAFNFGRVTGIDFSGEAQGMLVPESSVRACDLARIGFGQTVAVTALQLACAAAAANEPDWATETAKRIAKERRFLSDGLAACGLTVFPGEANFLLFRSNDTGLHEKLAEHGIMIRNCDNYRGLSAGYYRVAVKTREASKCLLNAIKLIIENG